MFIDFQGISNARELGGIRAADGRRVKSGVLLRTAELADATDADLSALSEKYALRHVVDFRDASEVTHRPDREIPRSRYSHIPVLPSLPYETRALDLTPQVIFDQFVYMYRLMAEDAFCARAYERFFRVLFEAKGETVLWHCVQGKDRTGIAAILLLRALGASMEDAREDYFLTNIPLGREYEQLVRDGADEQKLGFMKVVLYVYPECLDAFISRAQELYGGVDGYIRRAVGLSEAELEQLREWYTE